MIGKHLSFFFIGFLFFFFGEIIYAKNVTFPCGFFFFNYLLKEKQKNSIVLYHIFPYIISRKRKENQ